MTQRRSPIDQAVDLAVYAPLGLLLERRRLVTELADRGRRQIDFARMLGRTAFSVTFADLRRAFEEADRPEPPDAPATRELVTADRVPDPEPSASSPPVPAPPVETLAIPDYDSLAAKQVVKRLSGLTPDELEQVRLYEAAHRGRRTILGRIDQLQS